ncbi:TPA: WG repeat-containing protein [Campylobacter coli]|nr:WG repeat-containing protein [Campylobacter coli]
MAIIGLNGKYSFMDTNGKMIINPKFDGVSFFRNGFAGIKLNNIWGFIDKNGKFVIEPKFDDVNDFNENLAGVKLNGKWGFIDKNGKFVIEPKFDDVCFTIETRFENSYIQNKFFKLAIYKNICDWSFNKGMTRVKLNGKWGFIDRNGEFTTKHEFNSVDDENLTKFEMNGKWGFIDRNGEFAIKPIFDTIRY